jgi:hypothetical protein
MAAFRLQQKIMRLNPNWTYVISQMSKDIPRSPWWSKKTVIVDTVYEVTVRGYATDEIDKDTDFHDFNTFLKEPLVGLKLEQFVDEIHQKVRAGKSEQDWERIEKEKADKVRKEIEDKMRAEFEETLKKRLAEAEEKAKADAEKDKLGIKIADTTLPTGNNA